MGEGIVTTIGSADTYKVVLESPDMISKTVLGRGLDVGTAFEILSIDIADVDVGANVGASLQEAQAEANKKKYGPGPSGNPPCCCGGSRAEMKAPGSGNESQSG